MGLFLIEDSDKTIVKRGTGKKQRHYRALKAEKFESFNSSVLGLGDISLKAKRTEVVCAIFDLQGFTDFCNQVDAKLVVPVFLSKFLDWFYAQIKKGITDSKTKEAYLIYCDPPFYSKFMGDGVMLLWNAEDMPSNAKNNILILCLDICRGYETSFYPSIKHDVAYRPPQLRCGVATGDVYSVGEGIDFVGACINIAARLQKMGGLSFCVARKGLEIQSMADGSYRKLFVVKQAIIRGIGEKELVYVLEEEYEKLEEQDKMIIREVD